MNWYHVGDKDLLEEGRVTTVYANSHAICLARTKEGYGALSNRCPHQGGPLGDGFLQKGKDGNEYVVCPWHAYEYDPFTGEVPGEFDDPPVTSYPIEVREDGLYVGLEEEPRPRTLMDQMVDTMINWGVDSVFGMVGHSNLGVAEAMYKAEQEGRLRYFGIRHEGAAAFAATGYAKLTGKPAACFSIAGPGATNLLTGLWDAKVDRVPVLALTGQVNSQVLGPGAFQEIPLAEAFEAVAAWSQTVLRPENASELMALALKHAIIKRDVGHLIFPDEVQTLPAREPEPELPIIGRVANPKITPPKEDLAAAVEMLNEADRPAIIVGNGGRPFAAEIIKLAEMIDAPIITTFKAKGTIPDDHPLACGVLGRSGTPVASATMMRSDVLLVLGASFSNHTSITTKRKLIQVDFDRMMLGKFHKVDLAVWGEIGATLDLLCEQLDSKERVERRDYVARLWMNWRADKQKRADRIPADKRIPNAFIMQELNKAAPENAVMAVDVGNNAYSFGMYFESQHQDVIMSGYLGSIGFAFPAAMGAWAAAPERKIIAVAGDGGFGQYLAEFTTAVKYKIPITLLLLNNSELAKISREQRGGDFHVWQTSLHNPNFAEYAKNCGGLGIRVTERDELLPALEKAIAHQDGPSLVEVISDSGQL
ncbi:MAG: thiamine pyrophosphate-binding protein [Chloroflexi bacterium]|nr:MAG: thiamine pyrophosphate-binding protein [Chloroflexota bacterium]MBL1195787.1 thiamine pyrophosphate-binding protein [Chloroflexota bacterium]NOH13078.1 Rieske 2Fe-2S domain-containing protein [Chloroflexota bacterium]